MSTEFILCDECGEKCHGGRLYCKECLIKNADHKQVETVDGILVDEKLVDIIEWLWQHDIQTQNSCQDNDGCIWIQIYFSDFERFLKCMVTANPWSALYYIKNVDLRYTYSDDDELSIDDLEDELAEVYHLDYRFCPFQPESVSIRFPKDDLDYFQSELFYIIT
jgi:hypothetical protein